MNITDNAALARQDPPLSPDEAEAVQRALWRLMEKRARSYTIGDSDSLPVERLQALWESLRYTLETHLNAHGLSWRALLGDADALLDDAVRTLEAKLDLARALHREACGFDPPVASLSWRDTLASLGKGFNRYDYRLFAQEVPCSVDYQLCLPAPTELCGVDGVIDYLRRFLWEIALMKRLDRALSARLLRRALVDPEGLLVNLYEPLMANAVGAAMAGLRAQALDVPGEAGERLAALMRNDDESALRARVASAAECAANELDIRESAARQYFAEAAQALVPRMLAALPRGGLGRVFTAL